MNKFFVSPDAVTKNEVRITGQDVNHIKNVLRMRPGEEVLVSVRGEDGHSGMPAGGNGRSGAGTAEADGDPCGAEYRCRLRAVTSDEAVFTILDYSRAARELPSRITLFQGLPKGDKMELILQKAVELGAYEIVPVSMARCVVKIEEKKKEAKRKRWQMIAESAAAQSKRGRIPEVMPVMRFSEALAYASGIDVMLLPYEDAKDMNATRRELNSIRPGQSVGVWIGPEGGFAPEEVEAARGAGARVITLGNRILRTETAGLAVLSILGFLLEPGEDGTSQEAAAERRNGTGSSYGDIF